MLSLLPPPQELRHSADEFSFDGHKLFLAAWDNDDATAEVVDGAIRAFGARLETAAEKITAPDGALLVIARDIKAARTLARRAARKLDQAVPTTLFHREGPYFHNETSEARRRAQKIDNSDSNETYYLNISPEGIVIRGRSRRGLFWGVHTLRQVLESTRAQKKKSLPGLEIRDWPLQKLRGMHFDMKYFFPRCRAIEEWLRNLAALKINTVLFEYEDKFPYQKYPFLRHASALKPEELRRALETARRHHLEVIPLIQTLGHLEYCLKHEELAELREAPDIYFQINPLNPDAQKFVLEMIDEVLEYHADAEYFHVGADETWFLGNNPQTKEVVNSKGEIGLYLDYIVPVLDHVIARGKRPVLWDDILREHANEATRLPRETVLGYWDYGPRREDHGPRPMRESLQKHYKIEHKDPKLWPDTLSIFPFFDYYQEKGFEVLAVPCCNYGTLVPNDAHSGRNTLAFTRKASDCGGLGTLNSQWASFKMPFAAMWWEYALTALAAWSYPPEDTSDFDVLFSRAICGEAETLLVTASRMVAEGVGMRIPGAGRPFNLLHFAVMDSELNFDGGIEERFKKGSDMLSLDFTKIARRKIEGLQKAKNKPDVLARLAWVESQMRIALQLLNSAQPSTRQGKAMFDILLASAQFKLTRAGSMRLLLDENSPFKTARAAIQAEDKNRQEMQRVYGKTLQPADLRYEVRLLFDGERALLRERAN